MQVFPKEKNQRKKINNKKIQNKMKTLSKNSLDIKTSKIKKQQPTVALHQIIVKMGSTRFSKENFKVLWWMHLLPFKKIKVKAQIKFTTNKKYKIL